VEGGKALRKTLRSGWTFWEGSSDKITAHDVAAEDFMTGFVVSERWLRATE
jgi:hypothetical protein